MRKWGVPLARLCLPVQDRLARTGTRPTLSTLGLAPEPLAERSRESEEDVRHDLHVVVRVLASAGPGRDDVLVHDAQGAEGHVPTVGVAGKREGGAGLGPTKVGLAPAFGLAEGNQVGAFRYFFGLPAG